jgi:ribosome-associated toxin RatA of RatAB toxin-antitoxin module
MTTIHKSALVAYSAEQMYALVNDVERYPQFLPGCTAVELLNRASHELTAKLVIAKGGFKQAFTTHNIMEEGRRIEMQLVEGPFKRLHGTWRFHPLGTQGSEVSLHLEFEMLKGLLGMAFGSTFSQLANSLVDAFCQRAVRTYGADHGSGNP